MSHTYTMNWLSVIFPHDERTGVKKNNFGEKGRRKFEVGNVRSKKIKKQAVEMWEQEVEKTQLFVFIHYSF